MILIQQLLKINVMKYFKIYMILLFGLIAGNIKSQYTITRADSAQMAGDARLAINLYHELGLVDNNFLNMAMSYAQLGNKDSAMFYLNRQKNNFVTLPVSIVYMPGFRGVYDDENWKEIARKLEDNYFSNNPKLDKGLVKSVWQIYADDQMYRERIDFYAAKYRDGSREMDSIMTLQNLLDSINQTRLSEIVKKYGWPDKSTTGYEIASIAPFFVLQHTRNIEVQKKYLPIILDAVKSGKEDGEDYACLVDQVLLKEGKKQKYGTQLSRNKETGKQELYPLEDVENIDEIRKEIGLMPLVEFLEMNEIEYENH